MPSGWAMPGRMPAHSIVSMLRQEPDLEHESPPALSEREREVMESARMGITNAGIAGELGVTVHTVKFHLASVYRKLGAANRTDAVVRWMAAEPAR
jgi:DNA-binding NarL/FixJ family response regulator